MILNAIFRGIKAVVDAVAKVIAWLLIALGLWIPLVYTLIFVVVVAFTSYTMAELSTIYFFGLFISVVGAMLFSMMRSTKKAKERKHKSQTGYNISEVQRKNEDPIETIEAPPTIQNEYTYYEPPEEDSAPLKKQSWEEQVQQFREEQAKARYSDSQRSEPVQRSMWDEPPQQPRTWEEPQRSNPWEEPRQSSPQPDLWHTIKPARREEKPKTDRWGAPLDESESSLNDESSDNQWNSDLYDTSWSSRSRDRRNSFDEPKNNWDEPDWLKPKNNRTDSWGDTNNDYSPKSTEWAPQSNWNEPKSDSMWGPRQNDRRRDPRASDNWQDPYDDFPRQNDYNRQARPQNYDNYNNDYNRQPDYNRPMGYNRQPDYGRDNRPMTDYGAPMDGPIDYNRPMDNFNEPVSDETPKIFRLREEPDVLVYEYSDRLDYYKRSPQGNEFLRRKFK